MLVPSHRRLAQNLRRAFRQLWRRLNHAPAHLVLAGAVYREPPPQERKPAGLLARLDLIGSATGAAAVFAGALGLAQLEAGCSGMSATQALGAADATLNAVCASLTFLPDQVAVCAGVQAAEEIAALVNEFVTAHASSTTQAAARAARAARMAPAPGKFWKVTGLPVYAPAPLANALNEPKENAALRAYVAAGLAARQQDAGSPSAKVLQ
jgi:hypothetical protein